MTKRILILSNHFITLYNFRKELIRRLIDEGHEIYISMPKNEDNIFFEKMGCTIIETDVDRRGINPIKDMSLFKEYTLIMKKIKPDIIFSYTIKPNIYGSMASNLTGFKQVNNITGTGATFIKKSLISEAAKLLYKLSIKNSYKVFFQNSGDLNFFIENKLVKNNYGSLPGSGVNLEQYSFSNMPAGQEVNFIFIGRVMHVKGIEEYLEAAKEIRKKYTNVNFYIAGFIEEEKYKQIIESFHEKGVVNYIGFQKNIKPWIEKCHCTVLPSHGGEGVPNVLLESAAMGRVCIASNIPGSNEVIDHTKNGFLFEKANSEDLIKQITYFINLDSNEKNRMGLWGRAKVQKEFDRKKVINTYIDCLK